VFLSAAKAGILQAVVGHVDSKHLEVPYPGNVPADKWDNFHEFIVCDELSRCGSGGALWGLIGGLGIGLPPVVNFASDYLKDKVIKDCLAGRKNICLAITEPSAGSDVANLKTEAKKSPCGKYYILNGEKKWITNGIFSDFFTVAW
jgi:alkylation response protein AidB-like acyl-CoA dehydrogenase